MIKHSAIIIRAKELRNDAPKAEVKLWHGINDNKLGVKFRRQKPIGRYFVDFVCLENKMIIELDGEQHAYNKEYDNNRTDYLESLGYRIIRIPNEYIYKELDSILNGLRLIIEGKAEIEDLFWRRYE